MGIEGFKVYEIAAWLDMVGCDDRETRLEYYRFIMALDKEWVRWARQQSEESGKTMGKK